MRGLDKKKRLFQSLKQDELRVILDLVKDNPKEYFLGIRDEYVNIYYKGGNLLRITPNKKINRFKFEFDKKYFGNSNELIPESDAIKEWIHVIPKLKTYIKKYQNGGNSLGQVKNEKMVQQSILNNINSSTNSDYYITDMEYSSPGIGYGRFDYVAVKKKKDDVSGKYKLALIELKYGASSFGTSIKETNGKISYGSGIVGHAFNFSRFVYGVKRNNSFQREKVNNTEYDTLQYLRKETVNILKNKSELGLLDIEANGLSGILEEENIDINESNIETLLICVSCAEEDLVKNTITKYLGFNKAARYNVNKLKREGEIADNFNLKCFVTKEETLECLCEKQFVDLTI